MPTCSKSLKPQLVLCSAVLTSELLTGWARTLHPVRDFVHFNINTFPYSSPMAIFKVLAGWLLPRFFFFHLFWTEASSQHRQKLCLPSTRHILRKRLVSESFYLQSWYHIWSSWCLLYVLQVHMFLTVFVFVTQCWHRRQYYMFTGCPSVAFHHLLHILPDKSCYHNISWMA